MEMQELTRFIIGLRSAGVTDEEIVDLLMYIESGEEKYKPNKEDQQVHNLKE